ncbi:3'-5' exonuclease [bacterium]|nr:MAG: 3'-5' exonuclease [bacterium]
MMWWKRKPISFEDHRLNTYARLNFNPDKKASIFSQRFVILDCESTGINKNDSLISIGAIALQNQLISVSSSFDVRFPIQSNNKQAEIHGEVGATGNEVVLSEGLAQFLEFLGDAVIVGFSVSLDLQWIQQALTEHFAGLKLQNKVLDIVDLLKRVNPKRFEPQVAGTQSFQLDVFCDEFSVPIENRHTALGDAYMSALLFMKLLQRLKKRGVLTLGELLKSPNTLL